jgi:hypothetical protein
MAPNRSRPKNLYQFHYGCQLFPTETRTQKQLRLARQTQTKSETAPMLRRNLNHPNDEDNATEEPTPSHPETGTDEYDRLGFNEGPSLWEDTEEIPNEEDEASRARLRSLHQEMIEQQRHRNWQDVMSFLFPAYLHFKKLTTNWTLPNSFHNHSDEVCLCPTGVFKEREVDLIDLMGKSFNLGSPPNFLQINAGLIFRSKSHQGRFLSLHPGCCSSTCKRLSCKHTRFPTDRLLCPITQLLRSPMEHLQRSYYTVRQSLTTMERITFNEAACQKFHKGMFILLFS